MRNKAVMAASGTNKGITNPHVFVLWSEQFDGEIADIITAYLHKAGIRVKIVGVRGPIAKTMHGNTFQPDLSIGEALTLTDQAICIVIPCDFDVFSQIMRNPQLEEFLQQAETNNAQFVGHEDVIEQLSMVKIHERAIDWVYTDEKHGIHELAHLLTHELLK